MVFLASCAGAAAAGWWAGETLYFSQQVELLRELREVSMIIFGIAGAWSAIVYPDELKNALRATAVLSIDKKKLANFRAVTRCLVWSAAIVGVILVMQFSAPIVGRIQGVRNHAELFRRTSFAASCILAVIQIWNVLLMLVPINSSDADVRAVQETQENFTEGPQGKIGTRANKSGQL
jgi:hypothetical protein